MRSLPFSRPYRGATHDRDYHPDDVARAIDELRSLEMLTRAAWLRREIVLAIRASRIDKKLMAETSVQ
jgi:hypothetical protein